jgi:hypothetical protein
MLRDAGWRCHARGVTSSTVSYLPGRAYRDGVLICSRVHVAVTRDVRTAPDSPVAPRIRVSFAEDLDGALRDELERLVRARGTRGERLAETLAPLEVVWDEPRGARRLVGRLQPPRAQRYGPLEEISFPLRAGAHAQDAGAATAAQLAPGSAGGAPAASEPPACDMCAAPAVYRNADADEQLCGACGIYVAGQHHGKAAIARELLGDAIGGLLAAALTREHIESMADGELEGVYRPSGPDIARTEDPRPWVRYLLDPIAPR